MKFESVESLIQWLGGSLAFITLAVISYGIWRGTQRQVGRITGHGGGFLRSPWLYLGSYALFIGICCLLWHPLPLTISPQLRFWLLVFGAILFFPGMILALWGRLALGKYYFVSTGWGAQLFADHQLITDGPFAFVRHPMYLGFILASLGSLFMYATWTTLFFACSFAPILISRAHREESGLAAEFGEHWQEYCKRAPAFLPRLGKAENR